MYNKYRKWRNHKRGLAKKMCKLTSTRQSTDVSFFYLCSCFSIQFLYRTVIKATFSVKDNINVIKKNSTTLTINTTRLSYDESYNMGGKTVPLIINFLCLLFYNIILFLSIPISNFLQLLCNTYFYLSF